jgi:hypothetical protein
MCLMLGAAEVAAALVRKRNGNRITPAMFAASMTQLRSEAIDAAAVTILPADNPLINRSVPLSEIHAINATDAVLLRAVIDAATQLRTFGNDLVLLESDLRLLRAAQSEGLLTFNPETETEADLDALL